MKRKSIVVSVAVAVAALAVGVSVNAQVKKGKERPLLTKQLMSGLVRPNCADLGKEIKAGPADDKAWEALATKAALLNEAGHILMADGRCPDGTWAGACKTLREESQNVLTAIDKHDAAAAQTSFEAMTKACASCHKAHKK